MNYYVIVQNIIPLAEVQGQEPV